MVSNIFNSHPYLGKISNLTNIFQMGWKHQPVKVIVAWWESLWHQPVKKMMANLCSSTAQERRRCMPTLRHLSPLICGTKLTQRVDTSKIPPRKANGWTPENTPLGKFPKHLQDSPNFWVPNVHFLGFHTTLFVFPSRRCMSLRLAD